MLPSVNFRPPFNITRTSHLVLRVNDLRRSRAFYTEIVGLVVSDETDHDCCLRGLSEACHHSLRLVQTEDEPSCERIGFRVFFEEDLDTAYRYFVSGQPTTSSHRVHERGSYVSMYSDPFCSFAYRVSTCALGRGASSHPCGFISTFGE